MLSAHHCLTDKAASIFGPISTQVVANCKLAASDIILFQGVGGATTIRRYNPLAFFSGSGSANKRDSQRAAVPMNSPRAPTTDHPLSLIVLQIL